MSHENSITIQNRAGKWVNISTVDNGRQMSDREAEDRYNQGKSGPLGGMQYDDVDSAVKAAKERSKSFRRRHK